MLSTGALSTAVGVLRALPSQVLQRCSAATGASLVPLTSSRRQFSSAGATSSSGSGSATQQQQKQQASTSGTTTTSSGATTTSSTATGETLAEIRARVFDHHLGDGRRSGRKALLKPLRGKEIASWYFMAQGQDIPFLENDMETE
jgi:hypothetical protein